MIMKRKISSMMTMATIRVMERILTIFLIPLVIRKIKEIRKILL